MIKKILNKSLDFINPPIIQFSPIRTGSTLVYNILREVFPAKRISKKHNYSKILKNDKMIVTFRNPMDSLASSIKRYKLEVNDVNIKNQILELKENGLDDLYEIFQNKNILKLKYENFYNNYDFIFNNIETYFNIKIHLEDRQRIKKKYNVEVVFNFTKQFQEFSEGDKSTNFHGSHISNSKGLLNSYKDLFNK